MCTSPLSAGGRGEGGGEVEQYYGSSLKNPFFREVVCEKPIYRGDLPTTRVGVFLWAGEGVDTPMHTMLNRISSL